jgi:hypothetical protein
MRDICDIIDMYGYLAMWLQPETGVSRLVDIGLARYFVVRSPEMQLRLFECYLSAWLGFFVWRMLCVEKV